MGDRDRWYIGLLFMLVFVGLAVGAIVGHRGLSRKLDQIIANWNGCKMTCGQDEVSKKEVAFMYAYDEERGVWDRVSKEDVEFPVEVVRVLCEWAEWLGPDKEGPGPTAVSRPARVRRRRMCCTWSRPMARRTIIM